MTVQSRYVNQEKAKCRLLFADMGSFPVNQHSFNVYLEACGSQPWEQTATFLKFPCTQISSRARFLTVEWGI